MKKIVSSNWFFTKVLPSLLLFGCGISFIYGSFSGNPGAITERIAGVAIVAITVLNLYLRRNWLSQIIGVIVSLIFFYLLFAVLSEYSEFPNPAATDALRLLVAGLALCLSGMATGVLLMLPFKQTHTDALSLIK